MAGAAILRWFLGVAQKRLLGARLLGASQSQNRTTGFLPFLIWLAPSNLATSSLLCA